MASSSEAPRRLPPPRASPAGEPRGLVAAEGQGACADQAPWRPLRPPRRWRTGHRRARWLAGRRALQDDGEREAALGTAARRRARVASSAGRVAWPRPRRWTPPLCPWPRRAGDSTTPPPERPPRRRPLLAPPSWPASPCPLSSTPWASLTSASVALLRRRAPAEFRLPGGAELRRLGTAAGRTMALAHSSFASRSYARWISSAGSHPGR